MRTDADRRNRAQFLALLAGGAAIRLALMVSRREPFTGYPDARTFVMAADRSLFWNPYRPAGYPLLLRAIRRVDSRLTVTVATQHALGVGTAVALHRAVSPFLSRPGLALLPLGVVLFGGSQIALEHSLLSESPYTFALAGAFYLGSRAANSDRGSWPWLTGMGAALGASATLRSVGVFTVFPFAVWASGIPPRSRHGRLLAGAAVGLGAAAPVAAYLAAHHRATGAWGLTRTPGFTFYARMAPIADCARFRPPAGSEALCESTPPRRRPNGTWYMFGWPDAPALKIWGVPPYPVQAAERDEYKWAADRLLGRFALSVLRHQPRDYLVSVLWAIASYAAPHRGPPSAIGWDHRTLLRELRNPHYENVAQADLDRYYAAPPGNPGQLGSGFARYLSAARLEGLPCATIALLGLAGVLRRPGQVRRAASLFSGVSLSLAVLLSARLFYDARYATPIYGPLAAAAALGLDRLVSELV